MRERARRASLGINTLVPNRSRYKLRNGLPGAPPQDQPLEGMGMVEPSESTAISEDHSEVQMILEVSQRSL